MLNTKQAFIELALQVNALQWGEFTLKSGRVSPYFFNAGLFYHGSSLRLIGQYYAELILKHNLAINHLYGPAYKGIPLATSTAIALSERDYDVRVSFNRKESKYHGEHGQFIGAPITGPVVMIDDVITAGTAFREAQQLIQSQGGRLTAVIIALDRCERGLGSQSTLQEIQAQGIAVFSLITLMDIIDYLRDQQLTALMNKVQQYHTSYGA